jgi:hypothetical protein
METGPGWRLVAGMETNTRQNEEEDAEAAQTSPLRLSLPFRKPDHLLVHWSRSLPCIAAPIALCALPRRSRERDGRPAGRMRARTLP